MKNLKYSELTKNGGMFYRKNKRNSNIYCFREKDKLIL